MTQQTRPSQFVVTYGPGAILEGANGPRIIPRPDIGLFTTASGRDPANYEISDQRMSQGLLGGARIFRLPSNAELRVPDDRPIYATIAFPGWRLCQNSGGHAAGTAVLYQGFRCTSCGAAGTKNQEAIRFIRACYRGHMDDVDWSYVLHGAARACAERTFNWRVGGGALRQIDIECPLCGSVANLGEAYSKPWPCNGRSPESEPLGAGPQRFGGCGMNARIIQRQASNLRMPDLRTLFTIPPRATRLHNLLQQTNIYAALAVRPIRSQRDLRDLLEALVGRRLIARGVADEIESSPWPEARQAIQDVLNPIVTNYSDLLLEEFRALLDAIEHGHPPVRGPAPSSPVIFEVNPNIVRDFPGHSGTKFRVAPILRLRTITVQRGFRREVDTHNPAATVDVSFRDHTNPDLKWYPGVEFAGEGIFITSAPGEGHNSALVGTAADAWRQPGGPYPDYVFRTQAHDELDPVFVWWHTLSHLLMRAVSIEAGYSSASIRERVYFEKRPTGSRGGVLLYATQPGTEGQMGGLLALVPGFGEILEVAFGMMSSCSGDPLCSEHVFVPGGYNGAACYACLLVSETSCEHRNMWLDRNVLLENAP